jgi:hypothetical protein
VTSLAAVLCLLRDRDDHLLPGVKTSGQDEFALRGGSRQGNVDAPLTKDPELHARSPHPPVLKRSGDLITSSSGVFALIFW